MVVQDLDLLFDILDTDLKGYLTIEEVQLFDESTFFEALDLDQINAAFKTIFGNKDGRCTRGKFSSLLQEMERRRALEAKVSWDFKALDMDKDGRISLHSALFLFKSIHGRKFSLKLWNSFLSSRYRPEDEVSFDEIRLFLCNIAEFDPSEEEEYRKFSIQVRENQKERDYNQHQSLVAWQEDEAVIVQKEKNKQLRAEKLKNGANHLIDRIEEIGLPALLEEDDGYQGRTGERPLERVNATDLLDAMKNKYDSIRDHLLLEMLKIQVGEGMWAALSSKEQNERLQHLKVEEERLRKDGKLELTKRFPGAKHETGFSLLTLMDESIAEMESREIQMQEKMKESGMDYEDVEQEFLSKIEFTEKQLLTTDQHLIVLNERLKHEQEFLANRLQGIGDVKTMSPAEREGLLAVLLMMHIRAINELSFESAALNVGLTERLHHHTHDSIDKDKKRHEKLARKRLLLRKGHRVRSESKLFIPVITRGKKVSGRVDIELDFIQNMERRLLIEREVFINFLLNRDTQQRTNARKLGSDGRANQSLVLKTQWQGWRDRNSEDKMTSLEQHRALLQEAVAIVFENRKEESRRLSTNTDDMTIATSFLTELQKQQENECKTLVNFTDKDQSDIMRMSRRETRALEEEWFDNIAAVIFGLREVSNEEEEVIKALNDKYDALRDQLLLEALKKQLSDAEWAKLSEQERQARLTKLRLMERRLRKEGKYDEAAALLGDALKDSDLLQSLMGENRQRYLEKLQERLRARKKRIQDGEEVDDDEENMIDDDEAKTTGNILKDLQLRYEQEKEALLRKLQEGEGRFQSERERQAELMRLRLEKRKAEREGNFESAALVLGLAERNQASREEQLKRDRERQEQLARERLEARRNAKKKKQKQDEDPEPEKDDIPGWQDSVMKELEKRHNQERDFLMDLMKDPGIEDIKEEAKSMSEDERHERIAQLKDKREELDFEDSSDHEEHGAIMEMAVAVKMAVRQFILAKKQGDDKSLEDIDVDDVIVSLMADLQQVQDKEAEKMIQDIQEKTQEELARLRTTQINQRKYEELSNVASVVFAYEGAGTDQEIVKALDKKYDTLLDKLILDSLKKQLGAAEWAAMSEKERQAELLRRRLEQKRLMREGKLEEASRLLGEGFAADANLKKLMGQNRARYEEMMKEKLARRRERLQKGLPVDDDEEDEALVEFEGEDGKEGAADAKSILEDMQKRYEEEKEALMAKLKGDDARFLSEKERQAELTRLRREQRKAQQEEKFGAAALVLGLAERNQAAVESRLKTDRARQEQLARERLERMKERRNAKKQNVQVVTDGNEIKLRDALLQHIELRHSLERETLLELLQHEDAALVERAKCLTLGNREERLKELGERLMSIKEKTDRDEWMKILQEMTILKEENRVTKLKSNGNLEPSKNDVNISIMADLQQLQDKESETKMKTMSNMDKRQLVDEQMQEVNIRGLEQWPNVVITLSSPEETANADDDELVDALQSKYDTLKEKLIYEALERKLGAEHWSKLSDEEKYEKMMEIKMKIKTLQEQGKTDELQRLMADLFPDTTDVQALLGASVEEQERRMKEREELRAQRRADGMSEEEIDALEKEEDRQFEEELKKKSTKNILLDLDHNFEAEKEALLATLRGANAKFLSERERQAELARLKREQRRARKEDKFESAALVLSVAKTQQAELESKLKSDRERQEKLAKARLLARRNKREQAKKTEDANENFEDINDASKLQEAVLGELEKKHTGERDLLLEILHSNSKSEYEVKVKQLDVVSKQRRLDELKVLRTQWREAGPAEMIETTDEQIEIFREAASLKLQLVLDEIGGKAGENDEEKSERSSVKILADLQENQDMEASYLMKDLSSKAPATLKQLCKVQNMARNEKWYDNVAACLLGIKRQLGGHAGTSEDDLVNALDSKYSELKEKLFIEVLKKKFGEEEWNNMSRKEQQEHLEKLRSEEARMKSGEQLENSLFGEVTMKTMDSYLEQSRQKKEQKLKKRMERKKRARELGITEEELAKQEGEDDEEDEKSIATTDMLKDLQSQYEAEKDALLEDLKGSNAKLASERERQLALIKLRREKQKIKREDKFDSAAIIFNMAKENKMHQEKSYEAERARQEQLAHDRLDAIRKKKRAKSQTHADKVLEEQQRDIDNDVRSADQLEREGTIAIQNVVLDEMEKKHHSEQEALVELLSSIENDPEATAAAGYLSEPQRNEKLSALRNGRDDWKNDAARAANAVPPDSELTEEEKKANADRISKNWETYRKILMDGLVLRSESLKQDLVGKGYLPEQLTQEVSIILLADLQEKQTSETNAMCTVISDKKSDFLMKVKQEQRKARREAWFENLANTVLGAPVLSNRKRSTSKRPDMAEISEETEELEEKLEEEETKELAALEEELEREKQSKKMEGLSEDEIMKVMAELQRQQEAKRKAVQSSIERQREAAKRRIEEKRRKRDEKQYEEDLALTILSAADQNFNLMREKSTLQKSKQHDSLEDRLKQRREQRKKRAEEEAKQQKEEEEAEQKMIEEEKQKEKAKKIMPPLPGGGLRREKTVVEQAAEMDDSEKQEIVGVLMREQTSLAMRLNREQTRQEEMVNTLRSKRLQKQQQREQEAAKILGIGERQKTIVVTQAKNERERQIQSVKDRVKRIKYERTMTVKEPQDQNSPGFESLLDEDETEGLTADEKMARIAMKMEQKFKEEGNQPTEARVDTSHDADSKDDTAATTYGGGKLDERTQIQRLKDRQMQKKKSRKNKGGVAGEADMQDITEQELE